MKKIIALLLVVIMVMPTVISCSQEPEYEEEMVESVEETLPVATADLEGKEFKIYSAPGDYGVASVVVDNQDTVLNTAIFNRNSVLEERLNFTLKVEEAADNNKLVDRVITLSTAATFEYDLYYGNSNLLLPQSTKGYYLNSSNLSGIDFSNDWWNDTASQKTAINGKMYGLVGDANIHFYESIYIVVYNKDMAETLVDMPNLVQKAKDGDWTWDQMHEYTVLAHVDADNSASKTDGDTFGFATGYNLAGIALLSSGEDIVKYDKNNYPSFDGFTERTIDIFEDIQKWFYQSNATFVSPGDNKLFEKVTSFHDVFTRGDALFYSEPIGSLQKLRDVEYEYTVLPIPKYDVKDEYRTTVMHYAYAMFVPATTPDVKTSEIVLDNLMYQSYVDVIPAYLEQIVSLQRVRNSDSYAMLNDIIFKAETTISLLQMYDWNGLNTAIRNCATGSDTRKLSTVGMSLARSMKTVIEASIGPKQ